MTDSPRTAILSMICLPLAACMLGTEEPEAIAPEAIGSAESTLCTDGPADAVVTFLDRGGFSGATSPLETDHYDRPGCQDRFTVEVTGVSQATHPFSVIGSWLQVLTEDRLYCERSVARVQTHEYTVTGFDCSGGGICIPIFGWRQVGNEVVLRGQLVPIFDRHYCRPVPESPLPELSPSVFRTKVRVAVKAFAATLPGDQDWRAEAGVYSPPIVH